MTDRHYYQDAYTITFLARIVERFQHHDQVAVVLDQTYFYPASGGQPCDLGTIKGINVVDVFVREADQAVVHVVEGEIWADEVQATITWHRRFDHMQQHTGQHILSQAFLRVAEAETISFHLGSESVTIDLEPADFSPVKIELAETLANQIIWENRPVRAYFVDREQVEKLPLMRKVPALDGSKLRIVDIQEFDQSACGGTHVAHTGEIGLVKIVKLERRGDMLRVDFRCGQRALFDYRHKNSIVNRLAGELTTGFDEIIPAVAKLREESRQSRRLLKQHLTKLLTVEAGYMLEHATVKGDVTLISHIFSDRDPGELRMLASQLAARPRTVVFLGLAGPASQLIFARSEDGPGEMNQLIGPALQVLGSAAGGGTATFAQGAGPAADHERLAKALSKAEKLLAGLIR
jgi:alanyl-tRNA synthetase